jgi:DNA-binding transcriptional LysR family regulator
LDLVTQMRVFVRVAEAQGFTAAARQLGVSKSVVSKYIGELEDRLGVRLFHRTTRSLSLSEHGASYYERCTHILAEIEEAEATIGASDDEPRGTVRVLLPTAFALEKILPAFPALLKKWPKLGIDLVLDDFADVSAESGADVAVRLMDSLDVMADEVRELASVPMALVAAPGYMQTASAPTAPHDLAFHNCLALARPHAETSWRLKGTGGTHEIRVTGSFQVNSINALLAAARAGIGIALLPRDLVSDDLASGKLIPVLEGFAPTPWTLAAVRSAGESPPARVRAILDLLVEASHDPSKDRRKAA